LKSKKPEWKTKTTINNAMARNEETRQHLKAELWKVIEEKTRDTDAETMNDLSDALAWRVMSYFGYM